MLDPSSKAPEASELSGEAPSCLLVRLPTFYFVKRHDAGTVNHAQKSPLSCSSTASERHTRQLMHRALLLPEIVRLIFAFVRECDDSPIDDNLVGHAFIHKTIGKSTLASLARTCRAFHGPAIDELWMNLEALDPLIKLMPRRMWTKKHYPPLVRTFIRKKHWLIFTKYASRVKSLRGPCCGFPAAVQHRVMSTIAGYSKATLPLLPNLTEIAWCEIRIFHRQEPCVSLLRYFMGPSVTSVTLKLYCWPYHISSETAVLADLSKLCPNVSSFTAYFPPSSHNDPSQEVGAIVRKWTNLRTLRSCALPQPVMDQLGSQKTLQSLAIELNNSVYPAYTGQLPDTIHTFSLGGSSAILCTRYLSNVYGAPSTLGLRIGVDDSTLDDVSELFYTLPAHLDKNALRSFSVELTSSYWISRSTETFQLSLNVLRPLLVFRFLRVVDLDLFSTEGLDDDAYATMAQAWPALESIALGTTDVSKRHPQATVHALISLLKFCPNLRVLRLTFDGTTCIPEADNIPSSVVNTQITEIAVGHSPVEDINAMATCLGLLMPSLRRVLSARTDREELDSIERWEGVERMLSCSLRSQGINTD
ncbi:hypothetical protein ID866_5378 [Astraeus odoratus]|nr:hypothetical protein ID866_5378 [Astraeus odoratus]